MKHIVRIIGFLLPVAAIILVVLQVVVSNELAALGKRLGKLDQEVRLEADMHEALSTEVASASSLLVIRERAQAQGFVDPTPKQVISLSLEVPVALNRADVPVALPLE